MNQQRLDELAAELARYANKHDIALFYLGGASVANMPEARKQFDAMMQGAINNLMEAATGYVRVARLLQEEWKTQ